MADYNHSLIDAYESGVNEGMAAGLGLRSITLIGYCNFALAIWYGATMILENGYTGGTVVNILFAVMAGYM